MSADVATPSMPQTPQHTPDPSPERPRVGLFLIPTHRRRVPLVDADAWHGLDPHRLAWLIRHYTRPGDVVLDLDMHPTVARATCYLHRYPAILVPDGDATRVRLTGVRARPERIRRLTDRGVSLLLAGLPRPGGDRLGLRALTDAMDQWRRLLRPDGFLLTRLPAQSPQPGQVSARSLVITAARAAGLRYHQHLPVLLVPLPETEPRTDPATAAGTRPALLDGRHIPVHLDLLAFGSTTTDQEAANA
ncbi:hypothetical protein ABT369_03630 [Dactylosporangium sp. NPDC000244]|uniref:hypothetical protein n=1 Tax=Dactylosporangium sp. NPDC000244 TaxID=3154365 RepID=UPI00332CA953